MFKRRLLNLKKLSEKNQIQDKISKNVKKYRILYVFYIFTISKNNLVGIFCNIKVKSVKSKKIVRKKKFIFGSNVQKCLKM